MAKNKSAPVRSSVTPERAGRLYRLLTLLGAAPQARTTLTRRLRLGLRGFYRDLEVLREVGILIELRAGKYALVEEVALAIERLPFPDPVLSLGEARMLAKGRSEAHKKIRRQIEKIEN